MKILFICAVFPPEPAPAGIMAEQLATRLARDGHDIRMIVPFPNRPQGTVYPGFRRTLRSRSVSKDGYAVVRCANWLIGARRRFIDRVLESLTFGLSSAWAALREGRPDLIIVETWALFAASLSVLLCRLWRVPYIYYVQDLFPEAAEEAGMITTGGPLARTLRSWDRSLCSNSAATIVLSDGMKMQLAANRRLPHSSFTVIPDWIDESAFPVWQGQRSWRSSLGIPEDNFLALFAGTLGYVSGAEILVEVARILRTDESIRLLCIGEGVRKPEMVRKAEQLQLKNIIFLPCQPFELVPEIQTSCQIALLTMHPDHSDSSVPSKLISYLAAARPVVCATNPGSTVSRVISDAAAGLVVSPGNPHAIAQAIADLKQDPDRRREMGKAARLYFERHFTLERAYGQFCTLINTISAAPVPGSRPKALNT